MKVAIDLSPLYSDHQVRGVGFYTQRLLNALKENLSKIEIIEIKDIKKDNFDQADLVHIPYFSPFFVTLPITNKIPLVVTIHDLIPLKYPDKFPAGLKGKIRWQIQKYLLKKVQTIITDSNASAKDIQRLTGINMNKIKVIYLAADPAFKIISDNSLLNKIILKYNLPKKFVLYVGDVNWNKNIPGLLSSCQKVNIPVVVVGKQILSTNFDITHPENQDLNLVQEWIKKYPMTKKGFGILPLGFIPTEDLVSLYNLATIYIQPSYDEGFGLPVLEAMACGCPTLVACSGSIPEIAGKASILFDPLQKDDLENAIKKVFNNTKLKLELKKKGLLQVKKFSWIKTASETFQVYQDAINQQCQ